ncbi:hypothetical protein KIN20_037267 [Parelaphostrongylus tenuis]|uniref:Uncharacterized protein n=1 Tax=Parelaphostrongylus tenuis TaxID=148309 RepID=A0AAD5RE13_PARTN|nr:hypothetical protein KIN20_037267 [Parelaphostrongylus tenuis]
MRLVLYFAFIVGFSAPAENEVKDNGAPAWASPPQPDSPGWPSPPQTNPSGWSPPSQPQMPGWPSPPQPNTPGWPSPPQPNPPGGSPPSQPEMPGWPSPSQPYTPGWPTPPQPGPIYGSGKPPYYQPYRPPHYPPYGGPQFSRSNFDVAYCSVHASFPLVGSRSQDGENSRYSYSRRHRRYDRQSCRYTAIFSWDSCNTCCKVASRTNGDAYSNEIVGALFVFDPHSDFSHRDGQPEDSKRKRLQCVCCAPKRS